MQSDSSPTLPTSGAGRPTGAWVSAQSAIACVVLVAMTTGLAYGEVRGQPATVDGARAYEQACASCHRTPSRVMRRFQSLSTADRQAQLDAFLKGHHAPDAAPRAAIVAWLEQQVSGR